MITQEQQVLRTPEVMRQVTLDRQLTSLFRRAKSIIGIPVPEKVNRRRILNFIGENDSASRQLQTPEFLGILDQEKELKGDCKLGAVICIDGRESIIHQLGRTVNTWEVAGSLVESEKRSDGRIYLTSKRLIDALVKTAVSTEGRELLEIVTAHTSADPHHRCGKITAIVTGNHGSLDQVNDVALAAAELRAQAIENKYNEILVQNGKTPQEQVSIVAMVETDTMGLSLNFGKPNPLSTTDILMKSHLIEEIEASTVGKIVGGFGSMKDLFTEKDSILTYAARVEELTRYLIKGDHSDGESSARHKITEYIEQNYSKLTNGQKQALLFTLCRTIANQYVTGLSGKSFHHPFNEHDEQYIVVSPFGKPLGRHDFTKQTFGSTPNNREDALSHVRTKLSIMDSHAEEGRKKEPRIIFISNPIKKSLLKSEFVDSTTFAQVIDSNRKYYNHLLGDPELRIKIDNGEVIVVPLLVDEDTGETLHILDDSALHVTQGEKVPEMPQMP